MCRCATEKKNPKKKILASSDFFYLGHKTLNVLAITYFYCKLENLNRVCKYKMDILLFDIDLLIMARFFWM